MKDFWDEMFIEYGDDLSRKRTADPFDTFGSTAAIRRKDIAEKLVAICLRNQLGLQQSLFLLRNLIGFFRVFVDSGFSERFKFLQRKSRISEWMSTRRKH
jgi:hypothetical protein